MPLLSSFHGARRAIIERYASLTAAMIMAAITQTTIATCT
jgi:hypothetical protein